MRIKLKAGVKWDGYGLPLPGLLKDGFDPEKVTWNGRRSTYVSTGEETLQIIPVDTLCGADLRGLRLSHAQLSDAALVGADMSGADLTAAWLEGADLSHARLAGAMLLGANMCRAKLCDADLSGAYLTGAFILGADLSGACLNGAILKYCRYDGDTIWPVGVMPQDVGAVLRGPIGSRWAD